MDILVTDNRPQILSLGAGVQSTTLYLMAALGEITPVPELAIFADTQDEPAHVYEHLAWLEREFGRIIPILRVSKGKLSDTILASIENKKNRFASIPMFIRNKDGSTAIQRRECTKEFKIEPINSATWRIYKRRPIVQWIGISLDEATRMKPSRTKRSAHRWPLIELRMTRASCIHWLTTNGFPIPRKSACVFCPYHRNATWRDIRDNDPIGWQKAVLFDRQVRQLPGMIGETFLHSSGKPLDEVDLRTPQDYGQQEFEFDAECEGMCGV